MDISEFIRTVEERDDDWLGGYEYQNGSNFDIDFISRHQILSYSYLAVLGAAMLLGNLGNILVSQIIICFIFHSVCSFL